MKKRRLLALPRSPEQSPRTRNQAQKEGSVEVRVDGSNEIEVIDISDEGQASEVDQKPPPEAINGTMMKLYERGLGDEWLQLAWMRKRASVNISFDVIVPSVNCSLSDIINLPHDNPNSMSFEVAVNAETIQPDYENKTSSGRTCMKEIHGHFHKWISNSLGIDFNEFMLELSNLQECDWAVLLSQLDMSNIDSSNKLCLLLEHCGSQPLLRYIWNHSPMFIALLKPCMACSIRLKQVLQQLVNCEWVLSTQTKEFRHCVRQLHLQDHFQHTTNVNDGAEMEKLIMQMYFHSRQLDQNKMNRGI